MAIDPTATGSWGIAPLGAALGTPSVSTMPLAPKPVFTPEQIAMMRQHAMALQEPPKQNIQSWTQGLAQLARAIQGNREADFARQAEATGRQQAADAISSIYAPYLSPGGASPAARAAPAATLGSDAAGAIPSGQPAPPASTTTADALVPRGIRNNNPLNIEDGPFARSQPGYAGSDGRFAKFDVADNGMSAANSLLDSYQKNHGLNTIAGIVNRWAPQSDGNDTRAYAAHVAAQMGIGPNDPIPPEMRPQLVAAMARHENGVPLNTGAAPVPPGNAPVAPIPASAPPVRLAYAGNPPPGMIPNVAAQGTAPNMSPMINAIAGRPMPPPVPPDVFKGQAATMMAGNPAPAIPPADFARQAAAMMANRGPQGPMPPTQAAPIQPADFARQVAAISGQAPMPPVAPADFSRQAAAMMVGGAPGIPPAAASPGMPPAAPPVAPIAPPSAVPPAAAPMAAPTPVPMPQPRPVLPLPTGSAIPGAVGPTSVNGTSLVPPASMPGPTALPSGASIPGTVGPTSVNGLPLDYSASFPRPDVNPLVSAIAGRQMAPPVTPNGAAPIRVAQNGPPTSAAPMAPGGPEGLPQPLTSPVGQITQEQLTRTLANPWVPETAKAAMLQMIQQRGQPQTMPVEGGTLMFNAAGQKVFIPEPKFGSVKIGTADVPTVSHFDPASGRWTTTTLAPGGGVQAGGGAAPGSQPAGLPHPARAEPDLSTLGGIQANEVAQAGAKKGAETQAEGDAKYFQNVYGGYSGTSTIAAQQKPNIDIVRQLLADPDFKTGTANTMDLAYRRALATFGIDPGAAAPREVFNQTVPRILADQFAGLKSAAAETGEQGTRIFKPMLDIEEKALPNADDSPEGLRRKIDILDRVGNVMMQLGDAAADYKMQHGQLDASFEKQARDIISKSRIYGMGEKIPEKGATAPISKTVGDKTYYQINGKWFDNPEGK